MCARFLHREAHRRERPPRLRHNATCRALLRPLVCSAEPAPCARCGEKETLRHRLAAAVDAPAVGRPEPIPIPEKRHVEDPRPQPIPLDQIVVELNLEKYGKRYDNDRKAGIRDRAIHVGPDPRWNDAMAAAAEEYVAQALGLSQDAIGSDRPDPGWDMGMQGRRIQVKWTKYEDGKLIASPKQNLAADYYVLVTGGDVRDFRIAGWATAKELKSSGTDLGYGWTYALSQSVLRDFGSLLAIRQQGL